MTRDEFLAKFAEKFPEPKMSMFICGEDYAEDKTEHVDIERGALWAFDLLAAEIADKDARIAELEAKPTQQAPQISISYRGYGYRGLQGLKDLQTAINERKDY